MKRFAILITALLLAASCGMVRPEVRPGPYTRAFVQDPVFYNYLFWMVHDRLKTYTEVYLTETTGLDALICEMEPTPGALQPHQFLEAPVMNGWQVLEDSFILLTADQIGSLNRGTGNNYLRNRPSASYFVDFHGTSATVYIKYWLQDKFTHVFVYTYKKRFGKWFLTGERKL